MSIKPLIGFAVLASLGLGCAGTKVHFADAPADRLDLSRGRVVTSRASGFHLFNLIPINVNNRQAVAYERLKEEAEGDYLTGIKIIDSWKFAVIGAKYGTTMTATAYPDKIRSPVPTGQTLSQKLEEIKALHDKGALTDVEYESARKRAIGN